MKKIDVRKVIPADWELPNEMFDFNPNKSSNETINFCESMKRKAVFMHDNFLGNR